MRTIKFRGKVDGQWWYAEYKPDGDMGEWEQFWALVDGKTVGQFTTQKDIAGKEIYNGDICFMEGSYHGFYAVYWNEDRWGMKYGQYDDYDNGDYYQGSEVDWHKAEVRGNIYENSEPVEEKQ